MTNVLSFGEFYGRRGVPPLVFVDLHLEQVQPAKDFGREHIEPVVRNCRRLADCARSRGWQLGFVTPLGASLLRKGPKTAFWIEGLSPCRNDMVFERADASCYSSPEFAEAMQDSGGVFIMAGFSADRSCLWTMIDAVRHGHHTGFVTDASATRPLPGYSASESHKALSTVASRYASLVTAERWLALAATMHEQTGAPYGYRHR